MRPQETSLIVDLDPQGNASTGLGIEVEDRTLTTYDLLLGDVSLNDVIYPTDQTGLFIVPSTVDLSSADMELVSTKNAAFYCTTPASADNDRFSL